MSKLLVIEDCNVIKKCIVFKCSNHSNQGAFVGDMCKPCHTYITTGKIGRTDSFLGDIAKSIESLKSHVSYLS